MARTPRPENSIAVLSPRLFFKTSPSSFSAVGLSLRVAVFLACISRFKRHAVARELRKQLCCKSLYAVSCS